MKFPRGVKLALAVRRFAEENLRAAREDAEAMTAIWREPLYDDVYVLENGQMFGHVAPGIEVEITGKTKDAIMRRFTEACSKIVIR